MAFNLLGLAVDGFDSAGFGLPDAATFAFFGAFFNSAAPAFFASPGVAAFFFLGIFSLLLQCSLVLHHTVSLLPPEEKKSPRVHRLRPAWHL
jgi:hypothetical protein